MLPDCAPVFLLHDNRSWNILWTRAGQELIYVCPRQILSLLYVKSESLLCESELCLESLVCRSRASSLLDATERCTERKQVCQNANLSNKGTVSWSKAHQERMNLSKKESKSRYKFTLAVFRGRIYEAFCARSARTVLWLKAETLAWPLASPQPHANASTSASHLP